MRFSTAAFTALVIAATAASPVALKNAESKLERPCVTGVRLIVVSGHGAPVHAGYGLLDTTVDSILNAIPGSSNFSVPYPKRSEDFPTAIAIAAEHLNSTFQKYTAACPDDPVVLLGYSEGAQAIMNLLCGRSHLGSPFSPPLDSSYAKYIAAVVVYGDETRVPKQSYDFGSCRTGQGVNPRQNPDGCAAFAPVIESYCDAADPQCCGGKNQSQHYVYPKKYNDVATQYIVDQYTAFSSQ